MRIIGTTHPFSSPRHRRYRRIGWRSRPFLPPPPLQKQMEHAGTTHTCSSALRHLYSDRSTGGPVRYSKGSMGGCHRSISASGIQTAMLRTGAEGAATRAAPATVCFAIPMGCNRTQSTDTQHISCQAGHSPPSSRYGAVVLTLEPASRSVLSFPF